MQPIGSAMQNSAGANRISETSEEDVISDGGKKSPVPMVAHIATRKGGLLHSLEHVGHLLETLTLSSPGEKVIADLSGFFGTRGTESSRGG